MYKLMATISVIIRQFCIPNPFEALGNGLIVNMEGITILLSPLLLNWLAEGIIQIVTFGIVGLYYESGSNPPLGSLMYLIFYCIHIFLLWLMSIAKFSMWPVIIICGMCLVCHIGVAVLRRIWI